MTPQQPSMCRAEILPPVDPHGHDDHHRPAIAVAGLVHDLGNLIQVASSALNILARATDMPPAHNKPILHRARAALDHAGTIVTQHLGRLRDAPMTPPRSSVAAALIDVAALIGTMEQPDLVVALDLEPALPDVRCDSVGLRRAVLNLICKARDAMASNGTVALTARRADAMIAVEVVDHGSGMSPATLARVFDPYFTTKRDGLGGIGLPMVERFVRCAGGELSIDSELGRGTRVTMHLPILSTPQESE